MPLYIKSREEGDGGLYNMPAMLSGKREEKENSYVNSRKEEHIPLKYLSEKLYHHKNKKNLALI